MTLFKSVINFWTICQVCHSVYGMTNFWPKIYLGYTEEKPHKNLSPSLLFQTTCLNYELEGDTNYRINSHSRACLLVKSRAMFKLNKTENHFQ